MSNAYAQKKKNAIIAISVFLGLAMVLVVIIGILTTQTDLADRLDLPGITRTRRVIAAFCKPTHYKKECEKSLASAEEHNKGGAKHLDHKKLAAEAFKLTRAEITSALTKFPTVEVSPNDTRTQRALQVCTQLAKISIRDIERSERSIDHLGKGDFELFIEDLRVWTGGVLTYQDVCLNSFKKANGKAKDKMKVLLLKARERVANALAVIMEIENTPSGSEDEEEENEKEGESEEGKEKEGHKKEGKEKEGESEEGKEKEGHKEGKEKEGHKNEGKEKEGSNNEEEKEKEGAKEGKEKEGPNNEEEKKKEGNKNEENEKEGSNNEEEKVKEGNNNKEKEKEGKNDNTKENEGPNNKEEKGKEENKNEEKEKEGLNNENEKEKENEKEGNSNEKKEKELPNNKEENDKEKEGNKNEENGSNNEGEKSKQENTNEEKEKEGANIKEEKKELQVPIKVEKESVGPGNKVESEKDKKEKEKEDEGATKEMEDEGEEKAKETTDKEKAKEESGKDKEGDEKKKEEPEPGKENEKEAPNGGEGKEGKENEKEAPKEGEGKENEKEAPKGGEGKEGKEKENEGPGEGKEGKEKEKEGPEGGEGKEGLKKNKPEAHEKKSVRMAGKFPEWVSDLKRGILGMPLAEIKPDIVVAKDGSGKVKTLREALHLLPKKSENTMVIYVKEGVYHEHVAINGRMTSVVLVGDGPTKTIISGAKSFADGWPSYMTGTIDIDGDGFIARDIGFENTAGPTKLQAAAARVSSDYAIFYNCQFSGFHNTLYAVRSRQFYRECTISGIVDFISGDALAVFQNCLLLFRTPLPGQPSDMTAQARSDSNGPGATIIQNCTITTEPGVDPSQSDAFLGRPRRPYSRTIIMQSFIDKVISPLGWTPYAGKLGLNTLFYAEFRNKGPGSLDSGRVNWPGIQSLTMEEAGEFSPGKFFAGTDEWITNTGCPYYGNMLPM